VTSDLDIVIAGAGIGGLSAALSLRAAGFERIRILEAAPALRPLGVGLNILPTAVRELAELGLLDSLSAVAVATRELAFHHRTGGLIWRERRGLAAGYRWPQLSIHRGEFQRVLAEAVRERLGPDVIATGTRVEGFDAGPDRTRIAVVRPAPGTREVIDADLLIGADGIHSAVRRTAYPDEGQPAWSGLTLWRGAGQAGPYAGDSPMIVTGDDRHMIVVYPIGRAGDDLIVNWGVARPGSGAAPDRGNWNRVVDSAVVLDYLSDWDFGWLDVPGVVAASPQVYEYPMVDRDPLPRWTFGRTTLLGDAAHPMYPTGSNGATQTVLDARALAHHLATHVDVDEALAAYEAERRPVNTQIQLANRQLGPEGVIRMVHGRAPDGFADIHDVISADELAEHFGAYARRAGLDIETVNTRPSRTV
jgi:2-polyprenyl-6-methoxyphenol hydroxylase-like FAD-dependent oxidoreductase